MKRVTKNLIITAAGLTLAAQLSAQSLPVGSHYPIGVEGIKGADLPPPGFYVRDYNYFYVADKVDGLPADVDFLAYVQAPKVAWMTKWKILGADYGCEAIVPFAYKNLSGQLGSGDDFNLGDIYVCPLLLGWHFQQFDVGAAYGFWAPSGDFDATSPVKYLTSPGNGYWSHMFTLGGVWYPDAKKTWAISVLNRYEISTEQDQTHLTPGHMLSVEWGISKTVAQGIDLGLIGYYQQQVTEDSGNGASTALSHVVGVGPELNVFWKSAGLFTSLRYAYEADAKDRPQGHTIALTLTRGF